MFMSYGGFQRLHRLGADVAGYLIRQMDDQGRIFDVVDDAPTPNDHYAQTFLAWACLNLELIDQAERALSAFFDQPQGWWNHPDFNSFALANISVHPRLQAFSERTKKQVDSYLESPPFRSGPKTGVSNNWLAMQAATLALLGQAGGRMDWQAKARKIVEDYALAWQLPDGLFADFPVKPRRGGESTPLTYHAKICSMLIRYALLLNHEQALSAGLRGMEVLCRITFSDGSAFQFGRTNMGLFGYACFLDGLNSLLERGIGELSLWAEVQLALLAKLERLQEADGYIALNPSRNVSRRPSWDEYMHLTVYNAYFSALATIKREAFRGEISFRKVERSAISILTSSGLSHIKAEETELLLSLSGQAVLGQGHLFCDNRYAGMNICHLTHKDATVVAPPPLNTKELNGPFEPSFLGFHPWFVEEGSRYQFKSFNLVDIRRGEDDAFLLIVGLSKPVSFRAIDWDGKPIYERVMRKLGRMIIGRRRPVLDRLGKSRPNLQRVIFVHLRPFLILFIDRLSRMGETTGLYSPTVCFSATSWKEMDGGVSFVDEGGKRWKFLFIPTAEGSPKKFDMWSSSGKTTILSYPAKYASSEVWQSTLLTKEEERPKEFRFDCSGERFRLDLMWEHKRLGLSGQVGGRGLISIGRDGFG